MLEDSKIYHESVGVAHRAKMLGLSQSFIAEAVGASQSQVCRILSGSSRRRSRLFTEICKYVNSAKRDGAPPSVSKNNELMDAVAAVWDGTPQHAQALSVVIRSLSALAPVPVRHKSTE